MNPTFSFAPTIRSGNLQSQFEAFLDDHRHALYHCLDTLSEEQVRQREVASKTTLLGLVKHATFVERFWFGEVVEGRSRRELGLSESPEESFDLAPGDTITSVRADYLAACEQSRRAATPLVPDSITFETPLGELPLRWIYLHLLRELAQHCGHADILRERIVSPTRPSESDLTHSTPS